MFSDEKTQEVSLADYKAWCAWIDELLKKREQEAIDFLKTQGYTIKKDKAA